MAAFTVVLALATLALVGTAIYQHFDTLDAIRATNRFAKAAEDYAKEAKRLADAASDQVTVTRDTTKIAAQQLETAQDTEKRQLRAYVYVKPPPLGVGRVVAGNKAITVIAMRNAGQTPAYETHMRGNTGIGPYPLPEHQTFREGPYGGSIVLNPETETNTGGIISSLSDTLSQQSIDLIKDGTTHRMYVFGTVMYRDAFGNDRYCNYCFAYFGDGPTLTAMEYCDQHNDAN